jgi:hypothetical protein
VAGPEAGVQVPCTGCGATVLQKAMIPVAAFTDGVTTVGYLCVSCARQRVDAKPDGTLDQPAAGELEEDEAPV